MFCQKCGKEVHDEAVICVGCGCPLEKNATPVRQELSYDDAMNSSGPMLAIGIVLLVAGICVALFVSTIIGIVLCLVAEIVFVIPNSKVQKIFKQNNAGITDKAFLKQKGKELVRDLKKANGTYSASFIFAYIALACVIVFALLM